MDYQRSPVFILPLICLVIFISSCNDNARVNQSHAVTDPEEMNKVAAQSIKSSLDIALQQNGKLDDSLKLIMLKEVNQFYTEREYQPVWSRKEKWNFLADSLFNYIKDAESEGLFPKDYKEKNLHALKLQLDSDSLKRMDASLWGRAELMLTDGYMHIIHDLKQGRLQPDSVSLGKDTTLTENFYIANLKQLLEKKDFSGLLRSVQPVYPGYWELKKGIRSFVDSMDHHIYTYVTYPYKKNDKQDSLFFVKTIQRRLRENNCIDFASPLPDSLMLANSVKKYQKLKGLKGDGKLSTSLIRIMNTSDVERYKRIAITLDRYKMQLPARMPEKFIFVNLPGFYLQLWEHDSIVFESRIICGKPDTRTPLLNSAISEMITYPTWTVPTSIIVKQYLPKLKNNPNYLSRIGLHLYNGKGQPIDPGSVNWSKYSRGIPYKIMQGSGDNNALGVFKFNFNNKYAVYLHDTNQRYLFKNGSRAYSHGCVRVQDWQKLANYIARNDSINQKPGDPPRYNADSISQWITQKKYRRIEIKNPIPLYIQYFSCEGKNGHIRFFDDLYGDDKILREKYFTER